MALDALARKQGADESRRCDLLLALGAAQVRAGDWQTANETFLSAAAAARLVNDARRLAQAALGNTWQADWGAANQAAVELLEDALKLVDEEDHGTWAMLLARLADRLCFTDQGRAADLSREAVEKARCSEKANMLAYVLHIRYWALHLLGTPESLGERKAIVQEVIHVAERAADRAMLYYAYSTEQALAVELGDFETVLRGGQAMDKLAQELQQPVELWLQDQVRADIALAAGRFEEADRFAREALDGGQKVGVTDAAEGWVIQQILLRRERGEVEGLEDEIAKILEDRYPALARCAMGAIYCELGCLEKAQREIERLAENDFADLPRDAYWQLGAVLLSAAVASLGLADPARSLYDRLLPHCGRNLNCPPAFLGSACRYLGVLATTMERWPEAEAHYQHALEMNARTGARPYLAHTQYEYGRMLLSQAAQGDRQKALALVKEAMETARELRMNGLEEKARALAKQSPQTSSATVKRGRN